MIKMDEEALKTAWQNYKLRMSRKGLTTRVMRKREFVAGFELGVAHEVSKPFPDHPGWPLELRFIKLAHELSEHPAAVQMILAGSPNAVEAMQKIVNTKLHGSDES